jgi:CBS-domain-containing membrane protein
MKIKDLMTVNVITVSLSTTINEVAEILYKHHFTGVPVVDEKGIVRGVIAERDFIASDSKIYLPTYIKLLTEMDYIKGDKLRLPKDVQKIINATAGDIMNKNVVTISPEVDIDELAELFARKRVNPIPVVDGQQKLLGIVSRSDLIKLFSTDHREAALSNAANNQRLIDQEVTSVQKDIKTRFAYVAKFRANVWLTTAIVLFIIGFVAGIVYVVDPNFFSNPAPEDEYSLNI